MKVGLGNTKNIMSPELMQMIQFFLGKNDGVLDVCEYGVQKFQEQKPMLQIEEAPEEVQAEFVKLEAFYIEGVPIAREALTKLQELYVAYAQGGEAPAEESEA
jgi:hypothetical protein